MMYGWRYSESIYGWRYFSHPGGAFATLWVYFLWSCVHIALFDEALLACDHLSESVQLGECALCCLEYYTAPYVRPLGLSIHEIALPRLIKIPWIFFAFCARSFGHCVCVFFLFILILSFFVKLCLSVCMLAIGNLFLLC